MKIRAPYRSRKDKKVVGRGQGTGRGCTSGRGNKGQKARSGYSQRTGFEGGQMPLSRRIPKRGFNNAKFKKNYQVVNIRDLNRYNDGQVVDYQILLKDRLVNKKNTYVKLLGEGPLNRKLEVVVNKASRKAKEEIGKSGGTLKII